MPPRAAVVLVLVAALAGVLCACDSGAAGGGPTVTVTVPPTSAPAPSASTAAPASSASSSPAALSKLPGTCDSLLSDYAVGQALGGTQLGGRTQFVVGEEQKSIGRIGYLNCRYGVSGTGDDAQAKLEIGVSLYSTAAQATSRRNATVSDYGSHGAQSAAVSVGSVSGTELSGGSGDGYDDPLLVVASGQRTVAVTVGRGLATGAKATQDAQAVAALALKQTGG